MLKEIKFIIVSTNPVNNEEMVDRSRLRISRSNFHCSFHQEKPSDELTKKSQLHVCNYTFKEIKTHVLSCVSIWYTRMPRRPEIFCKLLNFSQNHNKIYILRLNAHSFWISFRKCIIHI